MAPQPSDAAPRPYHHGELRQRLIASALDTISRDGVGEISLRQLARQAGVSAAAPYHHFPDRAALFAAIIVEGHGLLLQRLQRAASGADDAVAALRALLIAYTAFAAEHPAHIRVMLRPELADPARHPEAVEAGQAPVELLRHTVLRTQADGALPPGDIEPLLHLFWSLAVGFVTLWVDGPIESRCHDIGTTPPALMASVADAVEALLRRHQGR